MSIQAKMSQAMSQVMGLNMLMWLTMLTFFSGLLACAAAAHLAMASVLPLSLAALFTGLGLVGVCLLLAILIRLALHSAAEAPDTGTERRPRVDNAVEQNLRPVIGDRATDWTRDHSGMAIVGALAAGVILTASPKLRHFVVRAAGPIFTRKIISAAQDFTN